MPRAEINNLGSLQNTPSNVTAINQNFERLLQAIEDAVSRTGQEKTYMEGNIDANSKRIFNLPFPLSDTEPLRKKDAAVFAGLVNINDEELYNLINQTILDFGTALGDFEGQLISFQEQLTLFQESYTYFESLLADLPTVAELENYLQEMRFPIGSIVLFPIVAVPDGFLRCEGQFLDVAEYPALFAVIGTAFGGDGVTTFRLPDTRGEFIRGFDNGRGVDAGRVIGSTQGDANKAHTHLIANNQEVFAPRRTLFADTVLGNIGGTGGESAYHLGGRDPDDYPPNSGITSSSGTESRPRNIAFVYCIKAYDGVTFGGNRLIERLKYEVIVSQFSVPDPAAYLFNFRPGSSIRLPANWADSVGYCDEAPTSDFTFSLKKNGVTVATATILAGTTEAVFSVQPTLTFGTGDKITLVTQNAADATIANISFRIRFFEV